MLTCVLEWTNFRYGCLIFVFLGKLVDCDPFIGRFTIVQVFVVFASN